MQLKVRNTLNAYSARSIDTILFCLFVAQLDEHNEDSSNDFRTGSYVLMLQAEDAETFRRVFGQDFMIAVWKAKKSLSQLIAQAELKMLYGQMESTGLLPKELVEDKEIEDYFLSMHEIKLRLRQQSTKDQ